jgi:DNA-directed RNA polymerase specialized sigma subunit
MEQADFKNYRALLLEVRRIKSQLSALEGSIYSPTGQHYSHTPRSTSGHNHTMDDAVGRHLELVEKYEEHLAELEAQQLVIEKAIASLTDPGERLVMRERYIFGKSWVQVCHTLLPLGYSERTVYRLHGFALLKLKEV